MSPRVRELLRHYWRAVHGSLWHLAVPMLLVLVIGAFEGLSFGLLIPLADGVAEGGFGFLDESRTLGWVVRSLPRQWTESPARDVWLAMAIIGLIVVARVAKLSVEYVRKLYLDRRNARYAETVKVDTFRRVLGFGQRYFDRHAVGSVYTELSWSEAAMEVLAAAESFVFSAFRSVVKVGVLVAISVPLTVAMVIGFPLVEAVLRALYGRIGAQAEVTAGLEREERAMALDLLSSMPLVKVSSQEDGAAGAYGSAVHRLQTSLVRQRRIGHLKNPLEESALLVAILLGQGIAVWMAQDFQVGDLIRFGAFMLVAQQTLPELLDLSGAYLKISEKAPVLEALAELYSDRDKHILRGGTQCVPAVIGSVRVEGLDFAYEIERPVLRDLHCEFTRGSVSAIVGESGAGKSTLAHILARLYDCPPATVFFDATDIRDFDVVDLHTRVALVSQHAWLLNRSLRENLSFGLSEPPSAPQLHQVLQDVELADFVRQLPEGLDTVVGDRGMQLSGGQRQRVALARALLRDPQVLILDEATAALDGILELKIEGALERDLADRIVIVIAHRLSTVRHADVIFVMRDGRIQERGSWDELIERGGYFAELHRAQIVGEETPTRV